MHDQASQRTTELGKYGANILCDKFIGPDAVAAGLADYLAEPSAAYAGALAQRFAANKKPRA